MSEFTSVTRCPYCKTSFHLGPIQLQAAGGKVRCGACLNTFDARAHFLVEQKYLFDSLPPDEAVEYSRIPVPGIEEDEFEDLQEESYPLVTHDTDPGPQRGAIWTALALVALLMIPVQLFWWQPPRLLEQSWYQAFLRENCDWLPCDSLAFRDIDYFSLTGVIQPSDTHNQVLTALLELRNSAPLPQPFPDLSIRFMDIRGELVSGRVFSPGDYLRSDASGRSRIAANQRVQIELDIYDPGRNAVSYEFEPLLPADTNQR